MTCTRIGSMIICTTPFYRLPLSNGSRVYMEWHSYFGPTFFHDKNSTREVQEWWENPLIVEALKWFQNRGNKA